jgi:hypothetical protein
MQYKDLNGHFRECIRARVQEKMLASEKRKTNPFDASLRDYVVAVIIHIADENDFVRAAKRLHDTKLQNPETAISLDEALVQVSSIYSRYGPEVSMLYDLYQMQEVQQADIMDIIAHMELRLMEELEQPAMEMPLKFKSTSLRRIQ